jgi:hypothetical protein
MKRRRRQVSAGSPDNMPFIDQLGCHSGRRCARFPELPMRRTLASFVVGVLVWSFIAPLALALTADTTPACCRRNGKHQCISGMSGMSASGGPVPGFRSQSTSCPYRSQIAVPGFVARLEISTDSTQHFPSGFLIERARVRAFDLRPTGLISPRGPPFSLAIA